MADQASEHDKYELAHRGPTHRECSWCTSQVPIYRRPGRPRLYCGHACRQRAYEHRHGFRHDRQQRRLPGQTEHDLPTGRQSSGSGYERGGHGFGEAIVHALRPCVRPEGRRRETLCGLLAAPSGRPFSTVHRHACRTCSAIAVRQPMRVPIEPSNELARLRAIIEEAQEHRHDPTTTLAWLIADHPDRRARAA